MGSLGRLSWAAALTIATALWLVYHKRQERTFTVKLIGVILGAYAAFLWFRAIDSKESVCLEGTVGNAFYKSYPPTNLDGEPGMQQMVVIGTAVKSFIVPGPGYPQGSRVRVWVAEGRFTGDYHLESVDEGHCPDQ